MPNDEMETAMDIAELLRAATNEYRIDKLEVSLGHWIVGSTRLYRLS